MAKNELAPVKDNLPAAFDYGEDAGAGYEGMGREDYLVPMLDIIQPNSGEMTSGGDFKAGQLIIRTLGETFDGKKGVALIPCGRQHAFVEWRPKDAGGGIVNQYAPNDPVVAQVKELNSQNGFGKLKMKGDPNNKLDHDLVETFYLFGVLGVYEDGDNNYAISETRQIVVPFTSTKISAYRGMMTKASMILVPRPDGGKTKAPLFAHRFRMNSFLVEKAGNKWFNYRIGFDGKNAEEARIDPRSGLYDEARAMYQLVQEGVAKIDTTKADNAGVDGGQGGGSNSARGKGANTDDIPF